MKKSKLKRKLKGAETTIGMLLRERRQLLDNLEATQELFAENHERAVTEIDRLRKGIDLAITDIVLMDSPEGDSPRNIAANLRAVRRPPDVPR